MILCLQFLSKLRVSDIQLNECDQPIEVILEKIKSVTRNKNIICCIMVFIGIFFILYDASEFFEVLPTVE